jgi:WD40 repeat protein
MHAKLAAAIAICLALAASTPGDPPQPGKDLYGDSLPFGAIARIGTTRWRPGGPCVFLAFLPDGKTALSVDGTKGVIVWELESGKQLKTFGRFAGTLRCAALSPDGRLVALGGEDAEAGKNRLAAFDVESGQAVFDPVVEEAPVGMKTIAAIAISPNGKEIALRHFGLSTVTVRDAKSGNKLFERQAKLEINDKIAPWENCPQTLAFADNGNVLVSADE